MANKILFYSSVKDKSLFETQKFYQIDIDILRRMGYEVILSNQIWDAFKFWSYDKIFAYFFRYSFFVAFVAKLFGKRVYITGGIDALDIEYAGDKAYKIQKLFFKLCYLVADKCIIVSKTDLLHVEDIVGKDASKLAYSEHSIETSAFRNVNYEGKSLDFCTIGWMGNEGNVKRKGIDKAIYLFYLLKDKPKFLDSKFYIMGKKGAGTEMLEKLINLYKLKDRVIIIGEVTEKQKIDILKRTSYYFQLSQYEGFGVAAIEALIAGNIIIHSGKGGLGNPIYKEHILVDIERDLDLQIDAIYEKISKIKKQLIKDNVECCISFYDNKRRLEDFSKILG